MSKLFISYAREDREAVARLYRDLQARGLEPWLDSVDLLPGVDWKSAIAEAIESSSHFIALLSSTSVGKRGYVQKELRKALDVLEEFPADQIFVIPVRIDDCTPTHRRLKDLNWVDLFPSYDEGLERIMKIFERGRDADGPKLSTGIRTHSEEQLCPVDIKNLLSTWIRDNREGLESSAIRFADVDRDCRMPEGTAKKILVEMANAEGFEVDQEGTETVKFRRKAVPIGRVASVPRRNVGWQKDFMGREYEGNWRDEIFGNSRGGPRGRKRR